MNIPKYIDYELSINTDALDIIKTLHNNDYEAYVVGGAIRDLLQNKTPKDYDIVTNATPLQIKQLFKFAHIIGRRFQLVHVYINRREFMEVSTYRRESNKDVITHDNVFGDIDTDFLRRDFTINALYYDTTNSQIIDWSNSLEDMNNKIIRPIGEASVRFIEDPVRMLRAIRFMTKLGFSLDLSIIQAIQKHKHLLQDIPAARLFEECIKLFSSTNAYANYKALIKYDIFSLLFPYTKDSIFIKEALLNTQERLARGLPSSPAFMFAVFLFDNYKEQFAVLFKTHQNKRQANEKTIRELMKKQTQHVQIPQFVIQKVTNTWTLQHKLEHAHNNSPKKNMKELLAKKDFRMAYDFLAIRSKVESELTPSVEFWNKIQ